MGSWSIPNTHGKATRLEAAMAFPLSAKTASDVLWELVGDDTLWDLFSEIAREAPASDVRPLVAAHLEQMTRWSVESDFLKHFELGVRDKLAFLAEPYQGTDLPRFPKLQVSDKPEAAIAQLEVILGNPEDVDRGLVAIRIAPGAYAILDAAEDKVFRVECRYGLVHEAPDEIRETIRESLFPTVTNKFN